MGLVVYVRNDPVNKIDPDGQRWRQWCIYGDCLTWWEDDPITFPAFERGPDLPSDAVTPTEEPGGGGPPAQSLDSLLANKALLESGLRTRAGIEAKKGKCYDFLVKVISQLSSGGTGRTGRGSRLPLILRSRPSSATLWRRRRPPPLSPQLGANARTAGNAISIRQRSR